MVTAIYKLQDSYFHYHVTHFPTSTSKLSIYMHQYGTGVVNVQCYILFDRTVLLLLLLLQLF